MWRWLHAYGKHHYERALSARSFFFNLGEKSEYERPAGWTWSRFWEAYPPAVLEGGRGVVMQPPWGFFEDSIKTAARSAAKFCIAYAATFLVQSFYTCSENFRSLWIQVSSPGHEKYNVRSRFQFFYATFPPTVSHWFLSNFEAVLSSPSCKFTVFLYYLHEVSGRSRPRHAKAYGIFFSNSFDSENSRDTCFISLLVCLNASICNNTQLGFSLWDVLIQALCQIRSTEDKWCFW